MKMRWAFLLLLPLVLCAGVSAEPLHLAELIDIALKNNPQTEKAWASAKRAQAALGLARSGDYPSIDVEGSIVHGREKKFPNGPNTVFTNYEADLSLSYLLFDFGERRQTVRAAKDALKAANWSTDFTIQRIVYKVAEDYYKYLDAQELLGTSQSSLGDAQQMLDAADELFKAGLRSVTDVSTSRGQVANLRMDLAEKKARVAVAYGQLLTTLGMPLETPLEVETRAEALTGPLATENLPQLLALAQSQRADLLAKQAILDEKNALVTRAKRAPLPKLRTFGEGGWLQYARHKGSGYNYTVGVALGVPIFKGFEYTYQKRLALADADLTLAELKELQDEIALEVLTYSEAVKASVEAFGWSGQYLDEATATYEGVLENYKAGLRSIFDVLQAQRDLADARIKRAQTKTQWLVSLAELAFATGSTMR